MLAEFTTDAHSYSYTVTSWWEALCEGRNEAKWTRTPVVFSFPDNPITQPGITVVHPDGHFDQIKETA